MDILYIIFQLNQSTDSVQTQFAGILSVRSQSDERKIETTEDVEKWIKRTKDADGKRVFLMSYNQKTCTYF